MNSNKEKDHVLDALVKEGLLGEEMKVLLEEDEEERVFTGALLNAAISSTTKASARSKKMNRPTVVVQNNQLFRLWPNGRKEFLKDIPKVHNNS